MTKNTFNELPGRPGDNYLIPQSYFNQLLKLFASQYCIHRGPLAIDIWANRGSELKGVEAVYLTRIRTKLTTRRIVEPIAKITNKTGTLLGGILEWKLFVHVHILIILSSGWLFVGIVTPPPPPARTVPSWNTQFIIIRTCRRRLLVSTEQHNIPSERVKDRDKARRQVPESHLITDSSTASCVFRLRVHHRYYLRYPLIQQAMKKDWT